jgi:hypothetical protein
MPKKKDPRDVHIPILTDLRHAQTWAEEAYSAMLNTAQKKGGAESGKARRYLKQRDLDTAADALITLWKENDVKDWRLADIAAKTNLKLQRVKRLGKKNIEVRARKICAQNSQPQSR